MYLINIVKKKILDKFLKKFIIIFYDIKLKISNYRRL